MSWLEDALGNRAEWQPFSGDQAAAALPSESELAIDLGEPGPERSPDDSGESAVGDVLQAALDGRSDFVPDASAFAPVTEADIAQAVALQADRLIPAEDTAAPRGLIDPFDAAGGPDIAADPVDAETSPLADDQGRFDDIVSLPADGDQLPVEQPQSEVPAISPLEPAIDPQPAPVVEIETELVDPVIGDDPLQYPLERPSEDFDDLDAAGTDLWDDQDGGNDF